MRVDAEALSAGLGDLLGGRRVGAAVQPEGPPVRGLVALADAVSVRPDGSPPQPAAVLGGNLDREAKARREQVSVRVEPNVRPGHRRDLAPTP